MLDDIHNPSPVCWTGKHSVNLLDPDPATLDLDDIARSLARRPRYCGFSDIEVSVAAHSLLCLDLLHGRVALLDRAGIPRSAGLLAMLMHDASEAYLSDIPRPLKRTEAFAGYREIEAKFEAAIAAEFGFAEVIADPCWPAIQKEIDNRALALEVRLCHRSAEAKWANLPAVVEDELDLGRKRLTAPRLPHDFAFALRARRLMNATAKETANG